MKDFAKAVGVHTRLHWNYLITPGSAPGVDLIRAVAISLVVLYHASIVPFGHMGVDVFFVISGFLIGGIIIDRLKSNRWSFKKFYLDRAFRILPVYYFMIALRAVSAKATFSWMATKSVVANMLFLQTLVFWPVGLGIDQQFAVGGSWSLVVEEWFYVITPAVLFTAYYLSKKRLDIVGWTIAVIIGAWFAIRLYLCWDLPEFLFFPISVSFPMRCDELAFGVIAAIFIRVSPPSRLLQAILLVIGLALASSSVLYFRTIPAWLNPPTLGFAFAWLYSLFGLGCALITIAIYDKKIAPAPVVFVARLSYTLYLGHFIVFGSDLRWAGISYDQLGLFWLPVVTVVVSIALAYTISLLIEFPFIRMYKPMKLPIQTSHSALAS